MFMCVSPLGLSALALGSPDATLLAYWTVAQMNGSEPYLHVGVFEPF